MKKSLMFTIRNTYSEWRKYLKESTLEVGIPESYRLILVFLLNNPGVSQKEVAEHCQSTNASVSKTVKEMQSKGYVVKVNDETDQRYFRLYLTEKGEICADALRKKTNFARKKIEEGLGPERENELIDALEEVQAIIKRL